jgi:hypothetical protein
MKPRLVSASIISLGVAGLFALTGVIAAATFLAKSNNPPAIRVAAQSQDELPLAARAPSPALPHAQPAVSLDSRRDADTENAVPTHDVADSGAVPAPPPLDEVATVTAEPASSTPTLPLDGAVVTTNGWLMQVEGASDGTYTLELADAPTGAASIVVSLPPSEGLPPQQHQANDAARAFVKETLLHGAEPNLRPWPLTHRPHVWLRGRLIPAPAGSLVAQEIVPASAFSFVPLAGTPDDPG